jgi:hypothetical protein
MIKIDQWSVIKKGADPYMAPEQLSIQIEGISYGHPRFEDGIRVLTSPVVKVAGRVVKTRNTEYLLGDVDPEYMDWYRLNCPNREFDPENPIVVVSKENDRDDDQGSERTCGEAEGSPSRSGL